MNQPLVSVIIPCYNAAGVVERAVASAFAQSHRPLEVICVDDGSTDETAQVLAQLQERYSELQVIHQPNGGAPRARNAGLAVATGEYIQFLDADDELLPGKIARQITLAETEGADIVAGSYTRHFVDGPAVTRIASSGAVWETLVWTRLGITSANLFRTTSVRATGGWTAGLKSHQEYDLMFRLLKEGAAVAFDPVLGATIYQQANSISTASDTNDRRMMAFVHEVRHHLRAQNVEGGTLQVVDDALFGLVRGVYARDPEAGRSALGTYLDGSYRPRPSAATSRYYVLLYRFLGFEKAQRLNRWLKRVRS